MYQLCRSSLAIRRTTVSGPTVISAANTVSGTSSQGVMSMVNCVSRTASETTNTPAI